MLLIHLFTLFLVVYETSGAAIDESYLDSKHISFSFRLGMFIGRRCLKNKDLEYQQKALDKLEDVKKCLSKHFSSEHSDINDPEEMKKACFEQRTQTRKCFQLFMDALQPCLDAEEGYATKFVMKGYDEYSKFFCENTKILTFSELLDTNFAKCINRFIKHPETNPENVCFAPIKLSNHLWGNPITKDLFCQDLEEVYQCYERHFQEYCSDSPEGWKFESGLITAAKSPCEDKNI